MSVRPARGAGHEPSTSRENAKTGERDALCLHGSFRFAARPTASAAGRTRHRGLLCVLGVSVALSVDLIAA